MSVKIGTVMSKPRKVTGGAVQGSDLGELNHNVVLNNLDDDLLDVYIAKYVDDMTVIDTVDSSVRTEIDSTGNRTEQSFKIQMYQPFSRDSIFQKLQKIY